MDTQKTVIAIAAVAALVLAALFMIESDGGGEPDATGDPATIMPSE